MSARARVILAITLAAAVFLLVGVKAAQTGSRYAEWYVRCKYHLEC